MNEELGKRIRWRREERRLGLRQTAARADISAPYLSQIEHNRHGTPPSERVLRTLAGILDDDEDTLLRLAGRIPQDVQEILLADPTSFARIRNEGHEHRAREPFPVDAAALVTYAYRAGMEDGPAGSAKLQALRRWLESRTGWDIGALKDLQNLRLHRTVDEAIESDLVRMQDEATV